MQKFVLFAIIVFFSFFYQNLSAQWVYTNGPYGSGVSCFAVNGSNLYAGVNEGVYLSNDLGKSWTDIGSGLKGFNIQKLAAVPDGKGGTILFAGVLNNFLRGGAVFRTTDNGISWRKLFADTLYEDAQSDLGCDFAGLSVFPNKTGGINILAGFYLSGIFLSTDTGSSWNKVLHDIKFNATTLLGSNVFISPGNKVYISTDNGMNWIERDSGITGLGSGIYVNALAAKETFLFAGLSNSNSDTSIVVYFSADNGTSWVQRGSGIKAHQVNSLAVMSNYIFAGTNNGIYVSTDNGISWNASNSGLETSYIGQLAVVGTNILASTGHGIFLSTDNGANWICTAGLIPLNIGALSSNGSNLLAGTNRGVYLSTDNGNNWLPRNSGCQDYSILSIAATGSNIFAGTYYGVCVSTDNGSSWGLRDTGIVTPNTFDRRIYALAIKGAEVLAGGGKYREIVIVNGRYKMFTYPGMFSSLDNGMNWIKKDSGLAGYGVSSLVIDSNNPDHKVLYATTLEPDYYPAFNETDGIYQSTNNGISWSFLNTNTDDQYPHFLKNSIKSLGVVLNGKGGTNLIAPYFCFTHLVYGIYVYGANISTDAGATWQIITITPKAASVNSFASYGTNIFAGTNQGVFVSKNSGLDWQEVNSGLANLIVNSLSINNGYLYAGTGNGVWKRPLSEITSVDNRSEQVPLHFTLNQNYPNPFNPATTIKYTIAKAGQVTLAVYDVLGREVATLVDEFKQPGNYTSQFSTTNLQLSSGVYFYRLQCGSFSQTKKFMLMK